jgi:hypothetical protein
MGNSEQLLEVSFEATLDEVADGYVRVVRETSQGRSWRRQSRWLGGVLCAACFALPWLTVGWPPHGSWSVVGIGTPLSGLVGSWLSGRFYDAAVKRRIRRFLKEQYEGKETVRCDVVLTELGVEAEQEGMGYSFKWDKLRRIDDDLEGPFLMFRGTGVLVPKRAFASPEEHQRFLAMARQLAMAAGASPGDTDA